MSVLELDKISYTYDGKTYVLKDFSCEFEAGKVYAIVGKSGAGKTTLLSLLAGLDKLSDGKILFDGKDIKSIDKYTYRSNDVGVVFQSYNLLPKFTARENVELSIDLSKKKIPNKKQVAMDLLKKVGLSEEEANRRVLKISGGQQQRVAIARALANNPKILLCDEATSALDPTTTKSILALLKEINEKHGITIVIITHSMSVVEEICNKVAIIDKGELAETGKVVDVFSNPQSAAAKKLVFPEGQSSQVASMSSKKCVRIVFSQNSSFEPVVANMVLEFKTPVNILLADTRDIGGIAKGQMILQLPDDEQLADSMLAFLKDRQLEVEVLENYVG